MAHHRDAVGLRGDGLAQLLDHLLAVPAGEEIVDMRAGVRGGLSRAVVDDGAERVALRAAHEEADIDLAAPFVAQLRGAGAAMTMSAVSSASADDQS